MDSLGLSLGYVPSEVGLIPEECLKMLSVVDKCGLGYAHPQTQIDPMTNGPPDLEEGYVSMESLGCGMTGSMSRGMLLGSDLSSCSQNKVHSS